MGGLGLEFRLWGLGLGVWDLGLGVGSREPTETANPSQTLSRETMKPLHHGVGSMPENRVLGRGGGGSVSACTAEAPCNPGPQVERELEFS